MDYQFFADECKRLFGLNGMELPCEENVSALYKLTDIMLRVNEQMNLTAITDRSQIILKHYVDSLRISEYIPRGARVIDVGCGAGFPSLPLAIFRRDLDITALDSTAKRIKYVQNTADLLGLDNLKAVAARAEDHVKADRNRESFDMAIARAVADMPVLCELCMPFVKVGGVFAAMKASKADEEYDRSKNAIKLCGGVRSQIISADLTFDGSDFEKRRLIIVEKGEKTPKIYPRNFAQIMKKPL